MRKALLFIITIISVTAAAQKTSLSSKITAAANAIEQKVIAWRRDIHEHPELSNKEVRTAALVEKELKALNIEVQTGVAKTGVVGILKGGKKGPVVALRADMDALPVTERTDVPFASKVKVNYYGSETGVMHACGHDAHVAMLLGVATILSEMRNDLQGTVKFIFQPAEEGAPDEEGGAEVMIREGVLENPKVDVIFGLHINALSEVGKIEYRPGGFYASVNSFKVVVKGRSAHGATPWSAVDPVVTAAQIINNLQTIISRNLNITENAGAVTVGAINGGNRTNIIPEKVEMLGTIRALSTGDEKMIIERFKQIVTKTAESAGATVDITLPYMTHYPVTVNDPALTALMLPTLQKVAGKENVELSVPHTGAEDFSFFEEKVPGLFFNLGGMKKGGDPKTTASHHTPDFYIDESSLKLGVKAMCNLTIDYLEMQGRRKK